MAEATRPSVSVILPTRRWGDVCEQLATQLRPGDELLVVCDTDADPVASHDPPDGVEVVAGGEPEGCAAKANALACGMERATNDWFVWSDDDYDHGPDWMERLVTAGETHGAAAFEPLLISERWCGKLVEPTVGVGLALAARLRGDEGGYPWGGGVIFHREHLDDTVDALCDELRSCVSDDNALQNHLGSVYPIREPRVSGRVDGGLTDMADRMRRWFRADHVRYDYSRLFAATLLFPLLGAAFPLLVAPTVTVAAWLSYRALGYERWTFLLAYPALFVIPMALGAGLFTDEFVWGSRRYRVEGLYDVEVVRRARD